MTSAPDEDQQQEVEAVAKTMDENQGVIPTTLGAYDRLSLDRYGVMWEEFVEHPLSCLRKAGCGLSRDTGGQRITGERKSRMAGKQIDGYNKVMRSEEG